MKLKPFKIIIIIFILLVIAGAVYLLTRKENNSKELWRGIPKSGNRDWCNADKGIPAGMEKWDSRSKKHR